MSPELITSLKSLIIIADDICNDTPLVTSLKSLIVIADDLSHSNKMDDFIYFGSNSVRPNNMLSNFHASEFEYEGSTWPSSEHAYVALERMEKIDRHRFVKGGDLSTLESGFKIMGLENKIKFWSQKSNVGIVAKMATRPDMAKKLGLHLFALNEEYRTDEYLIRAFTAIITAKYNSNPKAKAALMSTNSKTLVEFSRGAQRETLLGKPPRWNALVKDGVLYGDNLMGKIQMLVRSNF